MKKNLILFAVVFLYAFKSYSQEIWQIHKIDSNISVKLPGKPSEKLSGSLIATNKDSTIVYIITVIDFKTVGGIDSTGLAPIKETPEFVAQLKTGVQSTLHDVDLSDVKISNWHGYTSYTSSGPGIGVKKNRYFDMFMILIGSKFYSMTTIASSTNHSQISKEYFDSAMLNPK